MKNCSTCSRPFEIYPEDKIFYEKFQVPEPKTCPECRLIRRMCERNMRHLYYRKCDFTGKMILSQYHENHTFPVYSPEAWWSDEWDARNYGQSFDFGRPFFEQFKELKYRTPHVARFIISGTLENSEYNNCVGYLKNCYLISESDYDEDCYYSNLLKHCTNVVDCSICYNCELCYECTDCIQCYGLKYSLDCENSQNSLFLSNCKSCNDCIGCINQVHQHHMIFNQQYSKEEFEARKKALLQEGIPALRKKAEEFFQTQIYKNLKQERNENSLGDHLYNCKNSFYCFESRDLEDCRYCAKLSLSVRSSMDYNSWGDKAELMYQCVGCGDGVYNMKFCTTCTTNLRDCEYCDQCTGSSDLFGCIGLKKNQYCILNKQYSKPEYFQLKQRIIEHMKRTGEYGEFFPIDICPYAYNESFAVDHFPFTKEEAIARGFKWKEFENTVNDAAGEDIKTCNACGKKFKLIPQEVKFYNQMEIPHPEKCANCRHEARMKLRNPLKLFTRACAKCSQEIMTSFRPDRKEIVYCEKCYAESVY